MKFLWDWFLGTMGVVLLVGIVVLGVVVLALPTWLCMRYFGAENILLGVFITIAVVFGFIYAVAEGAQHESED